MDWGKTAMNSKEICTVLEGVKPKGILNVVSEKDLDVLADHMQGDCCIVAEAQAEISYKAGYKKALEGAVMKGAYDSIKKLGIKEVVEWGLETCPHDLFGEGTHCFKRACDECWQEKWGDIDGR